MMMWMGQLISNIGSGLTMFVLGIYVFKLTGSATYYSLLMLAAFLPALLMKPIGGTLSDRMDRRSLMIIGDLGAAGGVFFIVLMMILGVTQLWPIYAGALMSSVFVAFHNPAYKASVTDLVDPSFYTKASGLMQLAESSKILISPIIASILFLLMDIEQILILDVLTFIIGIIPVWFIKQVKTQTIVPKDNFKKDFIVGFQYLLQHSGLVWLLSITSLITFFVGFLQALWGPLILATADAKTLGIAQTIGTSGMLVSSGLVGIMGQSAQKIMFLSIALAIAGFFFALMGISSHIMVITCFGFMFFLALPFVNTSLDVLIRTNVVNNMQGRVWSIVSLISHSGMMIALGIAGYLADHFFEPQFMQEGIFASTVGTVIGVGTGRGIGFMFILSGLFIIAVAFLISRLQILRVLEVKKD